MSIKEQIALAWAVVSPELVHGIKLGLHYGLARQKGKTAAQVKEEYFTEIAKLAYEAGYKSGYSMGENAGK